MGRAAIVAVQSAPPGTVCADRAVFTSVRSPTGEGYRLVAQSAGISSEERREITQRSPSHGSLCDPSPGGRGLTSYPLESGRRCVACSRNAGLEHTARGGQRIYTDIAVLGQVDFERCGCDPMVVANAMCGGAPAGVAMKSPVQMEPLSICPVGLHESSWCGPVPAEACGQLESILAALLQGSSIIACGVPDPEAWLRILIAGLPRSYRKALSASCGVRLSSSRNFRLLIVQTSRSEARRFAEGRDAVLVDCSESPTDRPGPSARWLGIVRTHWLAGRLTELDCLSRELSCEAAPASLCQAVEMLCKAVEADRLESDCPYGLDNGSGGEHVARASRVAHPEQPRPGRGQAGAPPLPPMDSASDE